MQDKVFQVGEKIFHTETDLASRDDIPPSGGLGKFHLPGGWRAEACRKTDRLHLGVHHVRPSLNRVDRDRDRHGKAGTADQQDRDRDGKAGTADQQDRDRDGKAGTAEQQDRHGKAGTADQQDRDRHGKAGTADQQDRDRDGKAGAADQQDRDRLRAWLPRTSRDQMPAMRKVMLTSPKWPMMLL